MSTEEKKKPIIGITLGDFNGIGPQVILRALQNEMLYTKCQIVLFGSDAVLQFYKKEFPEIKTNYYVLQSKEDKLNAKMANLVECADKQMIVNMGISTDFSGSMGLRFINEALDYFQKGRIDALVTGPVNKEFVKTSPPFVGHTEFIAGKLNAKEPLMLMVSDELKVAVATQHIPLKEVATQFNPQLIYQKIKTLNESLQRDFGINRPKIAVLALNPHAGEGGKVGMEEIDMIAPAIAKAQKEDIIVQGAFPADGFFASGKCVAFDATLAMYHDQGLIPFKYIAGNTGVNFTANIPLVRTSPDHGVALDIVSKNTADHLSTLYAIERAIEILNTQKRVKQMNANPLPNFELKDATAKN